jgi:hypothetical protein
MSPASDKPYVFYTECPRDDFRAARGSRVLALYCALVAPHNFLYIEGGRRGSLTRWSAPVAQLEGQGHSLAAAIPLDLINVTKLFLTKKSAAAHNLLALLLAYAENEPLSFGAALEWKRRKLEKRSAKRPGDELFPVGLAVRKQKSRSLHVPLGAPHVEASEKDATQVEGIRRAENPQPDATPAEGVDIGFVPWRWSLLPTGLLPHAGPSYREK